MGRHSQAKPLPCCNNLPADALGKVVRARVYAADARRRQSAPPLPRTLVQMPRATPTQIGCTAAGGRRRACGHHCNQNDRTGLRHAPCRGARVTLADLLTDVRARQRICSERSLPQRPCCRPAAHDRAFLATPLSGFPCNHRRVSRTPLCSVAPACGTCRLARQRALDRIGGVRLRLTAGLHALSRAPGPPFTRPACARPPAALVPPPPHRSAPRNASLQAPRVYSQA